MITATQSAYIAGLFDGEGCIRYGTGTEHVFITSCYPHHLMWIQKLGNCGTIRAMKNQRTGHRVAYRLDLYGKNAVGFLQEIRPYLQEKAYQADILLSIRDLPPRSLARKIAIQELKKAKKIEYGSI